jgi:hypothetical protein
MTEYHSTLSCFMTGTGVASWRCRSVQIDRASADETRSGRSKAECFETNGLHLQ